MSEWRILSWSSELGRGAITSPHFARVDFDAAIADVDDFTVGEVVHIELDPAAAPLRVRSVWPDLPRFRARFGVPEVPALEDDLRVGREPHVHDWAVAPGGGAARRKNVRALLFEPG